jgi:hypothetical protein
MGLIIFVLLLGFSTTLYADYHSRMKNYSTFLGSVRMVFGVMAGDLHLDDFDQVDDGNSFYTAFGQVRAGARWYGPHFLLVACVVLCVTASIPLIGHGTPLGFSLEGKAPKPLLGRASPVPVHHCGITPPPALSLAGYAKFNGTAFAFN